MIPIATTVPCGRVLKVLKSAPYAVMEVEVGIPDETPFAGEPSDWGAEEGTDLGELELQVGYDGRVGCSVFVLSACRSVAASRSVAALVVLLFRILCYRGGIQFLGA